MRIRCKRACNGTGSKKVASKVASDEVYIHWGTITNETGRLLKNITFTSGIGSENKVTITQLRPNETVKLYKGPFPIGTSEGTLLTTLKGRQNAYAEQRIGGIFFKPLELTISLLPNLSEIYAKLFTSGPFEEIYEGKLQNVDFSKRVGVQVNIILRDGPGGRAFADSEVELLVKQ